MIHMIIVDDEVLSRIGIKSFFENNDDMTVDGCFESAREALDYLKQVGGTDIVITDIEMSEMTGLEFIEALKKQNLALGTMIISSYNDFEYARKAVMLGADSYILKQEIKGDDLIAEVKKIYNKRKGADKQPKAVTEMKQFTDEREEKDLKYRIGVLLIHKAYDEQGNSMNGQVNESMLVSLLESVLSHYENSYLFVPYHKEMFIVFQFPRDLDEKKVEEIIEDICYDLQQNIRLYINRHLSIGLSHGFHDLKELPAYHRQALKAVSMSFYGSDKKLYYTVNKSEKSIPEFSFSADNFLDEEGVERTREELCRFLFQCKENEVEAELVRKSLTARLNILIFKVLHEYSLPEQLMEKWNMKFQYFQAITDAEDMNVMTGAIIRILEEFHSDLLTQLKEDEFSDVLQFVNEHMDEKISLTEMAELNCMSTASFCKKFRERTGMTLIQYINQKKIEQVKIYLKHEEYTLGKIAELAGFSNENYMTRVFKKITGQTITDYKRGG